MRRSTVAGNWQIIARRNASTGVTSNLGWPKLAMPDNIMMAHVSRREHTMDKDRMIGSAKVVKGKIKEAVGKAVGDVKLKSEGKADKIEGEVQNAVGGLKDTTRGK